MDHPDEGLQPAVRQWRGGIAREFVSWQTYSAAGDHHGCSPNLEQLHHRLEMKWPRWKSLGCYSDRSVRGGTSRSSHAYGAAIDLSYAAVGRTVLIDQVIPYLIAWSRPWHLQAIHDYVGGRIWRAGRTSSPADAFSAWWKTQPRDSEGMGSSWATWIHLETTPDGWGDASRWDERGAG